MTNARGVLEWMAWKERDKERKANMTNEEWFDGLSTEEKADFFCTVQHCLTIYGDHIATIEDWEKWLKEKHHE